MNKLFFFLVVLILSISIFVLLDEPKKQPPELKPIPIKPIPPIPPKPPELEPGDRVEWINLPIQQHKTASTPFLTDIVSHLPTRFGNTYYANDRVTWGHETTHGINSYIRTDLSNGNVGFYVGNSKAAILVQPKLTLRQIGAIIPSDLRGSRYNLYFVRQAADWNDCPLYVFDEWTAYTNGAAVGLEIPVRTEEERVLLADSDVMIGAVEFSIYAMATCIAIDKYDPNYLQTNTQYKEFVAYELKRSIGIYKKGIKMPQYAWDTHLESNVKRNPEFIAILKKMYGDKLTMEKLFNADN